MREELNATYKILELAKEILKFGNSRKEYIEADKQSSSEYLAALQDTLTAIANEIDKTDDNELKSQLFKQRQDVLNRIETEKKRQREYFNDSDKKDKEFSKIILGTVTAVALGAGSLATKYLLENKKF